MKKRLTSNLAGGLGNQLNCYFAALYFADKYGYKIITLNSGTANSIHAFPYSLITILPKTIQLKSFKTITLKVEHKPSNLRLNGAIRSLDPSFYQFFNAVRGNLDDSSYTAIPEHEYHEFCNLRFKQLSIYGTRNIRLDGFFPSQWFYQQIEPNLQSAESILNFSQIHDKTLIPFRDDNRDLYCVLHLRAGGLLLEDRYSFGVLDQRYYLESLARIREEYPKIKIYAVSDDEQLASRIYETVLSKDVELIRGLDNKSPLVTFEFIRNATVVICANSSFSSWAARLSTKVERTFIPSKPHISVAGMKNLPNNWTKVANGFL